jgi:flagellar M-ring protein FliF
VGAFLQTLRNLGPARLGLIGAVALVLLGSFGYMATRLAAPDYALLYGDLDLKDSAQIVAKLDTMNVPYQVKGGGNALFVPADQVGRLRLSMAELGIPHNGSVGNELFDKPDGLGATTFQQNINEIRALEGELERTIESLSVVDTARVHLVLPKRELFARDKQDPSASIVIKTRGADGMGKPQIAGILNLVAGAVPGLKTNRISIIDQHGNLLAHGNGESGDGVTSTSNAEEQRVAYETKLSRNVEEMLERSLGYGHVRVDLNADMDFDRVTTTQELYNPDGQVPRSVTNSSETTESNQPAEQPVTVQTNLPDGQPALTATQGTKSKSSKNDELTNFEISKTTTNQVREAGVVKRLSVAVLVDGTYTTTKGERQYEPRSAEELASLTKLVQSAIGYDQKRGDRVEVVNMRFAEPPDLTSDSGAVFLGLTKPDLFHIGEPTLIAIVAILAILFVIRPMVNNALKPKQTPEQAMLGGPGAQGALPAPNGMVMGPDGVAMMPSPDGTSMIPVIEDDDSMIDISQVEGRVRISSMRKIGEIVDSHPEEAVAILRNWMYQTT